MEHSDQVHGSSISRGLDGCEFATYSSGDAMNSQRWKESRTTPLGGITVPEAAVFNHGRAALELLLWRCFYADADGVLSGAVFAIAANDLSHQIQVAVTRL